MAEKRAKFTLVTGGAEDLVRAGDQIEARYNTLGRNLKESVGGGIKAIGQGMASLAQDAVRVATAMGTISLGSLVEQTKQADLQFQRFATGTKRQLEDIKRESRGAGARMLMDDTEVNRQAQALGRLTYSMKSATRDVEALNAEATADNRFVGDELPLGVALRKAMGVAGDLQPELGKIRAQADALGYSGGAAAFRDTLASVSEQLSHVASGSDEARDKVRGFLGALTKDLKPGQQGRVAGGVLSHLQSNAETISRTLGHDILDQRTGEVADPMQTVKELRERAFRVFGGGAVTRRVLRREFGDEAGSAIYSHPEAFNPELFTGQAPSQAGPAAAAALANSAEGRQIQNELRAKQAQRDSLGEAGKTAQGWFTSFAADNPISAALGSFGILGASNAATGYLSAKLGARGAAGLAAKAASAGGRGLAVAAEAAPEALSLGAAQGEMAAAQMFGRTALSYGAKGALGKAASFIPVLGMGYEMGSFVYNATDAMTRNGEFAKGVRSNQRSAAAVEIAGRIARGGYHDVYEAAPEMARLAKNAGVGREAGSEDTLREVLMQLAKRDDLSPEFAKSVGEAVAEALRKNPPVIQQGGGNPSVMQTSGERAAGAGAT